MARPIPSGKKSVNLASPDVRVSRIRRDPPPKVKEIPVRAADERDRWAVGVGIVAFALAIFVILIAFSSHSDWSPRDYTIEV